MNYKNNLELYEWLKKILFIRERQIYQYEQVKGTAVQLTGMQRNSVTEIDFKFLNWLCENGFDGYSSGFIQSAFNFPDEVAICQPLLSVKLEKVFSLKRLLSEEDVNRLLKVIGK